MARHDGHLGGFVHGADLGPPSDEVDEVTIQQGRIEDQGAAGLQGVSLGL